MKKEKLLLTIILTIFLTGGFLVELLYLIEPNSFFKVFHYGEINFLFKALLIIAMTSGIAAFVAIIGCVAIYIVTEIYDFAKMLILNARERLSSIRNVHNELAATDLNKVRLIQKTYKTGHLSLRQLSNKYSLSRDTIYKIIKM